MKENEKIFFAGGTIVLEKKNDETYVLRRVEDEESTEVSISALLPSCSKIFIPNDDFVIVEAESLSLNDEFMQYEPKSERERITKKLIAEVIEKKVKNFYRPKYDPSFADNAIQFVAGKKPAVGKSYNWWVEAAKNYCPSGNSRLGTRLEYGAFLGVLIKKLVEEGKSVKRAWHAVCNDSKELGHYSNSQDAKHAFELTGSRLICGLYDLANTYKILAEDEEAGGFWVVGGYCCCFGYRYPLADLSHFTTRDFDRTASVGWLVLS